MATRSVGELLPKPFDALELDDVRAIIAAIGEQGESLFFERKSVKGSELVAKSCAAFANTLGGLLVVGGPDDGDELIGIEPIGEPQVWVKDVLRGRVLPMPAFRARSLAVDADHNLLLVLVEESSTTPHLLTRSGAIYVRNPGSSDPVPINDQGRLLDLMRRGYRSSGPRHPEGEAGCNRGRKRMRRQGDAWPGSDRCSSIVRRHALCTACRGEPPRRVA